jgi:hypothetical protein
MRAVLIINPVSGDDEPNEEKVHTIQKGLTSAPFVAEVYITKKRGAGVIAGEAVAAGVEVVLVVGGDGTVSEVAREWVHKPATLGMVETDAQDRVRLQKNTLKRPQTICTQRRKATVSRQWPYLAGAPLLLRTDHGGAKRLESGAGVAGLTGALVGLGIPE